MMYFESVFKEMPIFHLLLVLAFPQGKWQVSCWYIILINILYKWGSLPQKTLYFSPHFLSLLNAWEAKIFLTLFYHTSKSFSLCYRFLLKALLCFMLKCVLQLIMNNDNDHETVFSFIWRRRRNENFPQNEPVLWQINHVTNCGQKKNPL